MQNMLPPKYLYRQVVNFNLQLGGVDFFLRFQHSRLYLLWTSEATTDSLGEKNICQSHIILLFSWQASILHYSLQSQQSIRLFFLFFGWQDMFLLLTCTVKNPLQDHQRKAHLHALQNNKLHHTEKWGQLPAAFTCSYSSLLGCQSLLPRLHGGVLVKFRTRLFFFLLASITFSL